MFLKSALKGRNVHKVRTSACSVFPNFAPRGSIYNNVDYWQMKRRQKVPKVRTKCKKRGIFDAKG